jgi:hypothetical protein
MLFVFLIAEVVAVKDCRFLENKVFLNFLEQRVNTIIEDRVADGLMEPCEWVNTYSVKVYLRKAEGSSCYGLMLECGLKKTHNIGHHKLFLSCDFDEPVSLDTAIAYFADGDNDDFPKNIECSFCEHAILKESASNSLTFEEMQRRIQDERRGWKFKIVPCANGREAFVEFFGYVPD